MKIKSWHQAECDRILQFGRWAIALCLVLLLGSCQMTNPKGDWARVANVPNGRTLEVLTGQQGPQAERVSLIGITVPWLEQEPWGKQAQQYLQQLTTGKTLLLEADTQRFLVQKDSSKLRLVYAWLDGNLLNETLVEKGYALVKMRSPNTKYAQRLASAQEKARLSGVGIWNPDHPMRQTPEEFRKAAQ